MVHDLPVRFGTVVAAAGVPTDLPPCGIAARRVLSQDPALTRVTALSKALDLPSVRRPTADLPEEVAGTESALKEFRVLKNIIDTIDEAKRG